MKSKYVILASAILISVSTFAQKEELKTLKKIYAKDVPSATDISEYKANVAKLETLATEEGDKVYTNFYKSMLPLLEVTALGESVTPIQMMKFFNTKTISDLALGLNATLDFENKTKKKIYTDDINETITSFKPTLLNYAIGLVNSQKYKEAAQVLYSIYQLDKKDPEKLYYAANYAVNAQDFDTALLYFNELKAINYTGEGTLYFAKNLASNSEDSFASKAERDKLVSLKTHISPREEKITSKRGEIYKNIALLLVEKGKIEEAKAAIQEARKVNPEDASLILSEADLYYKLNDLTTYKKLITEALERNPNDADLVFNLGVVSLKANQLADAEKYFSRAIEVNPKYTNAYLNLADLKLQADKKIVTEINSLGTSVKDNKRYEVLKADRIKVFTSALPYLEKALELDPKNGIVIDNLLSVYNFLEMTDKYKALKATK